MSNKVLKLTEEWTLERRTMNNYHLTYKSKEPVGEKVALRGKHKGELIPVYDTDESNHGCLYQALQYFSKKYSSSDLDLDSVIAKIHEVDNVMKDLQERISDDWKIVKRTVG